MKLLRSRSLAQILAAGSHDSMTSVLGEGKLAIFALKYNEAALTLSYFLNRQAFARFFPSQ